MRGKAFPPSISPVGWQEQAAGTSPGATEILGAELPELFHGINVEESDLDNND